MKVDLFDFDLPEEQIAQEPVSPRDSARLADLTGPDLCSADLSSVGMTHRHMRDFPDLLRPGDVLVVNDTKVIPARLYGFRRAAGSTGMGAKIELLLHQRLDGATWRAFAKPARKLRLGEWFETAGGLRAETIEKGSAGEVTLRFDRSGPELMAALQTEGSTPLPPYIKRAADDSRHEADQDNYQTLFAANEGAVAAPTASLHYTPELIERIKARGVTIAQLTLHVGAGTFLPVKVEDTDNHKMHEEIGILSTQTAETIRQARAGGGRVIASGTTSLRLLESATNAAGDILPFDGPTDLFITPGYRFKIVDLLLTNFHLPRSTLFMLVCAFAGTERMKAAYQTAIEEEYRFFSYGDASLLSRDPSA